MIMLTPAPAPVQPNCPAPAFGGLFTRWRDERYGESSSDVFTPSKKRKQHQEDYTPTQWSDEKLAEIQRKISLDPWDTGDFKLVNLNVAALDTAFQENREHYITRGGGGHSIPGRYQRFIEFVNNASKEIYASTVTFRIRPDTQKLEARFANGRHRFAVLRDHGMTTMPVAVRSDSLPLMKASTLDLQA